MAAMTAPGNTLPAVTIGQMAAIRLKDERATSGQIAEHLSGVLDRLGRGEPRAALLPSVTELAGLYRRQELDVLDALFELKKRHYHYRIHGLDRAVFLKAPDASLTRAGSGRSRRLPLAWIPPGRRKHNPLWDMPGLRLP